MAIVELLRQDASEQASQFGGLTDLYFAMTSLAGAWTATEIQNWQKAAGLTPRPAIPLRASPNVWLQLAVKDH